MAHHKDDTYMLQVLDGGVWRDVTWVTMRQASRAARENTKRTGKSHRVMNTTRKDYVFVEAVPVI